MRISDWSSDVCSSDLIMELERRRRFAAVAAESRRVPMIDGSMQSYGLTLDKFLSHAAKWHPDAETVSAGADGSVARIGYAALYERARAVSGALHAIGVRAGHRVATLAWNTQGHLESWYGIIGMGAVCHTLNPRLTAAQIGAMLVQSEAGILLVSADQVGRASCREGVCQYV